MLSFIVFASLGVLNYAVPTNWTTSGLSSGAFFTVQMGVAWSCECLGIGVVAGGPYYCAEDKEDTALTACMSVPMEINVKSLESDTTEFAKQGLIDDTSCISNQRVYLFSGKKDTTVETGVVTAAEDYFKSFGATTIMDTTQDCAHGMVTNFYGNKCSALASEPYIIDCDYDLAGKILQFIYKDALKSPISANSVPYNNVISIDQSSFIPSGSTASAISLEKVAYLYVATNCSIAPMPDSCKLHVVFHGCEQDLDSDISFNVKFNDTYVRDTGYNQWAEPNNMVILYPQATSKEVSNPDGCWDWWGYNTKNYAFKTGKQMETVHNMIQYVLSGTKS